jgi:hypothetical protein
MCPHTTVCVGSIKGSMNASDTAGGCWCVPKAALCPYISAYICVPLLQRAALCPYISACLLLHMCPPTAPDCTTTCVPPIQAALSASTLTEQNKCVAQHMCPPPYCSTTHVSTMCPDILHEAAGMQYVV